LIQRGGRRIADWQVTEAAEIALVSLMQHHNGTTTQ